MENNLNKDNNIRVRAIIMINGGIAVIHRIRNINSDISEYYPLPGGGVEKGETLEQALIREIDEELGIEIKVNKLLYKINDAVSTQYIYLCDYVRGTFGTGNGPEFNTDEYKRRGVFLPDVIKLGDLSKTNLVPTELKNKLLKDLEENDLENIKYADIDIINTIVM